MKKLYKFIPLSIVLVLLFALPINVFAQEPPPAQTFSGDQLVLADNFVLQGGQILNGDLVVIRGNAVIESNATVNGDIAIVGGNLDLAGTVSGTISTVGGNVSLKPGAIVSGNVDSFGGNIEGTNQARILGRVNTMNPRALLFNFDRFNTGPLQTHTPIRVLGSILNEVLTSVLQILAVSVLALVVALLLPIPLDRVSRSIAGQPLLSGGVGLLTFMVAPLVLVILVITILLIPVALIAFLVLAVAVLFGWIAVGYEIGQRMAVLFKTQWAEAISAGLGTLVLGTIAWLLGYVFCLGPLLSILVASVGLGGVILSKFGTQIYATTSTNSTVTVTTDTAPQTAQLTPAEPEVVPTDDQATDAATLVEPHTPVEPEVVPADNQATDAAPQVEPLTPVEPEVTPTDDQDIDSTSPQNSA